MIKFDWIESIDEELLALLLWAAFALALLF